MSEFDQATETAEAEATIEEVETEESEHEEVEPEQSEDEQSEESEGESEDKAESDDEEQSEPKPNRAAQRIQQLVAEKRVLQAQLNEFEANKPADKAASNDGMPQEPNTDDYDLDSEDGLSKYFADLDAYKNDMDDWRFNKRFADREQQQQAEKQQAQIQAEFEQAFDKNPQFKNDFENLGVWMQDKPVTADPSQLYQGEELMDLLAEVASNENLYYEIASMTEQQQYAKFGQIQAQIKSRKNGNKVVTTKAPKPPNHTKSNAPIKRDAYDMSDDDFLDSRGL